MVPNVRHTTHIGGGGGGGGGEEGGGGGRGNLWGYSSYFIYFSFVYFFETLIAYMSNLIETLKKKIAIKVYSAKSLSSSSSSSSLLLLLSLVLLLLLLLFHIRI